MSFDLNALMQMMQKAGVTRLYAKYLVRNNNSRQQFYIARGDWSALQVLPMSDIAYDAPPPAPASSTGHKVGNYKASLNFVWLDEAGREFPAPNAQLILYPKYPEIRIGSLIAGAEWSPADLLKQQQEGRVLFLGVHPDGRILGYIAAHDSLLAREYIATGDRDTDGVLSTLVIPSIGNDRENMLAELRRINRLGWIDSKRLDRNGNVRPCPAPQCGGYTLEAELNIIPNGRSEPDYLGWEVKSHGVKDFSKPPDSSSITLLTPNPNGGFYAENGAVAFLRRYGYPDTSGTPDRINFGGVHRAGIPVDHRSKGGIVTTFSVDGYDRAADKVTDEAACGLCLRAEDGTVIARWNYASLLTHWQKKHDKAVYVPSMKSSAPLQYRYGPSVRLGVKTGINYFLRAVADGFVFYDPAPKLENASTHPVSKERHQFRIKSRDIGVLYDKLENQPLTEDA